MSTNKYVVVWDPEGKYWEGSLVDHAVAQLVRGRHGAAIPTDPELFAISGVGGYMRRGWGAGWPLEPTIPTSCCPLSLFLTQAHRSLHWAARIVATEETRERVMMRGLEASGSVQIMSYAGRSNMFKASVSPRKGVQHLRDLGPADKHGGWTVEGDAVVHPTMEGVATFALYGAAPGCRVAWAAISVTKG